MIATFRQVRWQPAAMVLAGVTALFLASPGRLLAQQEAAIVGAVVDPSGAILPGVTVTATSPALQLPSVIAITDARGEYRLTPLPIGTFAVEFTLSGFQTVRREGIILTASFVAKIDMQMKLGAITETSPLGRLACRGVILRRPTRLTRETLDAISGSRTDGRVHGTSAWRAAAGIDIGRACPGLRCSCAGQDNQPGDDRRVVVSTRSPGRGGATGTTASEAKVGTFGARPKSTRGVLINGIVKSGGNDFHAPATRVPESCIPRNNVGAALARRGISAPGQLECTDL